MEILVVGRVNFLGEVWLDLQAVLSAWAGLREKAEEETEDMNGDG